MLPSKIHLKSSRNNKHDFISEMDILRDQVDAAKRPETINKQPQVSAYSLAQACVSDYEAKQQLEAEINTLEQQLDQAAKLADMYREQCVQAEDELARIREESEVHRYTH